MVALRVIDMKSIDSKFIELIMLIESLIAVKKHVVERLAVELIEEFLIELIYVHVDTSEINPITIEKLIDV